MKKRDRQTIKRAERRRQKKKRRHKRRANTTERDKQKTDKDKRRQRLLRIKRGSKNTPRRKNTRQRETGASSLNPKP